MASKWLTKNQRKRIYDRDKKANNNKLTCCYCNCIVVQYDKTIDGDYSAWLKNHALTDLATLDHIVPQVEIAQACSNDKEFCAARREPKNLVTVCQKCNSSKQHTPLYVWAERAGFNYQKIVARIASRINCSI